MQWELAHVLPARHEQEWHAGRLASIGRLGAHDVVFAATGMGMVSAAAGTAFVLDRYAPTAVLNCGCAGAHRRELLSGDIVVGTRVVAYDNMRESIDGQWRYAGMYYEEAGERRHVDALLAHPDLLRAAERASVTGIDAWPASLGWPALVEHRQPRVWFGTVVSADRWNRTASSIERLVTQHDSLCEDMEAAAIAQVCASAGVPFLSVKDISNNELLRGTLSGQAMVDEIGVQELARRAANFTRAIIDLLPA